MAEFIKDLKIKNGVANKVLSIDNNGNIVSTDKTVDNTTPNKMALIVPPSSVLTMPNKAANPPKTIMV